MPNSRSAAAVCSPTAATLMPANARASRPYSSNFSRTARTAFTDVNAIHWYLPVTRPLTARSICCGVRGGSTAIVGTCSGTAPQACSRLITSPACSLVRGTSTRQPNSGLVSNQDSPRWAVDAVADHGDGGPVRGEQAHPGRLEVGGDRPEGADHGVLVGGGAVPGDGERGGIGPARRHQHLGQVGGPGLGPEDHQGARADLHPAHLGGVDDPDVAAGVGRQRDARVGGNRGRCRHAGHHLERHPRLRAGRGLGGGVAEQERVAAHQPDHVLAGPGGLDQQPRVLRQRVGVRDLCVRARQPPELRHQLRARHHQVGLGQQRRRPARSAGPHPLAPRRRTRPGRRPASRPPSPQPASPPASLSPGSRHSLSRVGSLVIVPVADLSRCLSGHGRISSRTAPEQLGGHLERPRRSASSGGPLALARSAVSPSAATTTARSRNPSAPAAYPPTGALQPASSAASRLRSAVVAARVAAIVRARQQGGQLRLAGPALHRQGPLARRGQHLVGLEDLGHRVEPADPGQARVGEHHRVDLAGRDPRQPGARVAADRNRAQVGPQQQQLSRPAWRSGADPRARRQVGELGAVPGGERIPRVVPGAAPRPARCPPAARSAGPSASAPRCRCRRPAGSPAGALTNTPVPPIWASWARLTSPNVVIPISSTSRPARSVIRRATCWRLGHGHRALAGAEPQPPGRLATARSPGHLLLRPARRDGVRTGHRLYRFGIEVEEHSQHRLVGVAARGAR